MRSRVQFHVFEVACYDSDGRKLSRRSPVVDREPHVVGSFLGLRFGPVFVRAAQHGLPLHAAAV
jgi:hypothetical protein